MRKSMLTVFCFLAAALVRPQQPDPQMFFQKPAVSRDQIAFVYAGDLWTVSREGGTACRLTTGIGIETNPSFSPDGSLIAFNGEYDGNVDVYVVPARGGIPRRLTFHPDADEALGWTPDGRNILFQSSRDNAQYVNRLYTIPVEGGFRTELPLPMGHEASFSPDGSKIAYVPIPQWQKAWKRYRGGQTKPIWIADLFDSGIEKLPRENSNDFNPMWIGQSVYFLSDRNGPVTLFVFDTRTKKVSQVLKNEDLDFKAASAGPGAIVYEQFGALYLYDLAAGQSKRVLVSLFGDLPEVRPHLQTVKPAGLTGAGISPTGARAVFQARGEILTVPAEKGDIRNITKTPGAAERDPAWSPDGKWIAYFSDESGEYALHIREQNGLGETRKISLGDPPSFFYSPRWSPDSKKIAYTDKRLNVWYLDVEKPKPRIIDTDLYDGAALFPVWSPDGKWIAYTRQLQNFMHAVFIYSLDEQKSRQITDGMSDALFAEFDKGGKYLYFTASTDIGLTIQGLDMSSVNRPVTRSVYAVVLRKDLPSPLVPESDEEKGKEKKADGASSSEKDKSSKPEEKKGKEDESGKDTVNVRIDFDNIGQRILALPIPARDYFGVTAGKEGFLFLQEGPAVPVNPSESEGPTPIIIHRFDLAKRKTEKILEGVKAFTLSFNGEKLLYLQGEQWFIGPAVDPIKTGEGALKLDAMEVWVDPRTEWKQMYRETWRIERDFFYDPGFHGLDIRAAEKKYAPYLENLVCRADLNYLFEEMLGEFTVGHMFVWGGEMPEAKKVKVGLLGADYSVDHDRYRFSRIFNGENWNPKLQAPLTQPGVEVAVGDYLLAVNGRDVNTSIEVYGYFEGTAGRSVVLKVGPKPDGTGSREVTVVPVESEKSLRNLAWIEGNRRKVDEMSQGRLAYVYLPNTAGAGYTNFNRYYFAQVDKQGAVIDERFNGGGLLADYIIDYMRRPIMSRVTTREGRDYSSPTGAIYGPKAMIINEMAGSGGDAMPWYFRKAGIGPLVGKRTWGGLVGIGGYPPLMDGGMVMAPRMAIYGLKGEWEVENIGIAPDIEVEYDPILVREGHDPQLEKAVQVVLELLGKNPLPDIKKPPYSNYHQRN
jgi:tricorn protease